MGADSSCGTSPRTGRCGTRCGRAGGGCPTARRWRRCARSWRWRARTTTTSKRFWAKHRGNLRRQVRAWREDPAVTVARVTDPAAAADAIDVVLALHAKRFAGARRGDGVRGRVDPAVAPGAGAGARGRGAALTIVTLRAGGVPVAAHYGFRFGGRLLHFQGGFDPAFRDRSPGTALTTMVLEDDVFGAGLHRVRLPGRRRGLQALALDRRPSSLRPRDLAPHAPLPRPLPHPRLAVPAPRNKGVVAPRLCADSETTGSEPLVSASTARRWGPGRPRRGAGRQRRP